MFVRERQLYVNSFGYYWLRRGSVFFSNWKFFIDKSGAIRQRIKKEISFQLSHTQHGDSGHSQCLVSGACVYLFPHGRSTLVVWYLWVDNLQAIILFSAFLSSSLYIDRCHDGIRSLHGSARDHKAAHTKRN